MEAFSASSAALSVASVRDIAAGSIEMLIAISSSSNADSCFVEEPLLTRQRTDSGRMPHEQIPAVCHGLHGSPWLAAQLLADAAIAGCWRRRQQGDGGHMLSGASCPVCHWQLILEAGMQQILQVVASAGCGTPGSRTAASHGSAQQIWPAESTDAGPLRLSTPAADRPVGCAAACPAMQRPLLARMTFGESLLGICF